jgi:branched-chain amino acid transport system permease protein
LSAPDAIRTLDVPERGARADAGASALACSGQRAALALAATAGLYALGPALGGSYFQSFLIDVLLLGMVALGLQGMLAAGVLNLGQAAFFGLGSYGGVWTLQHWGWTTLPALGFGVTIALVGALLMLPLLRLRSHYFVMASFAFGAMMFEIFGQAVGVTGGDEGILLIPNLSIAGLEVTTPQAQYLVALTLALLVYGAYAALMRSGYGLTVQAVRQSESAARAAGVNVARVRVLAVCVGVVPAGLAGVLYSQVHGFAAADLYDYDQSIALVTMVVLGGVASRWGAFAGAFIVLYLTTYTRSLEGYQLLVYGLAIAICMIVIPGGLSGLIDRIREAIGSRLAGGGA